MSPSRMPVGPGDAPSKAPAEAVPLELPGDLDESATRSEQLLLLNIDGAEHSVLRRAVMPRFSVRQARGREPWIRAMIAEQIISLRECGTVVDLWRDYAMHISARTHCHVIGVPDHHYDAFVELFVEASTAQQKYDFIRLLLAERENDPGEDVITDLLSNRDLDRVEVESLLRLLMGAGRDSVAYLIATASVALLTHPDQLAVLRASLDRRALTRRPLTRPWMLERRVRDEIARGARPPGRRAPRAAAPLRSPRSLAQAGGRMTAARQWTARSRCRRSR